MNHRNFFYNGLIVKERNAFVSSNLSFKIMDVFNLSIFLADQDAASGIFREILAKSSNRFKGICFSPNSSRDPAFCFQAFIPIDLFS